MKMLLMQPILEKSIMEVESVSLRLEKERGEAMRSKARVAEEKKAVDAQKAEVQRQYNLALLELKLVLPVLLEAEEALDTLVRFSLLKS